MRINKTTIIFFAWVSVMMILSRDTLAQDNHKPHTHGISKITIASDKELLQIHVTCPLMDIVGFETQPKTTAQKESLYKVTDTFKNWEVIFKFNGSFCKEKKILVSTNNLGEQVNHDHHNHEHEEEIFHKDLEAIYEFNCSKLKDLVALEINLSKIFPSLEIVNVEWVLDTAQGQTSLNREQNKVIFR